MAGRPGPRSQEGVYHSPSPSSDPHDPFSNSHVTDQRYYDNDSENADYNRRDTYASDGSNNGLNDDGYYDNSGAYDPYGECVVVGPLHTNFSPVYSAQQDTDSDVDVYGQKYAPSAESLGPPRMGISEASTPTFVDANGPPGTREPYPAWSGDRQIPLSKEEIEDIFLDLTQKFGFQRDSMRNMVRPLYAMLLEYIAP